jgi:hypothetical protein
MTGRCTGCGHGMTGASGQQSGARVLGFATGASGHSRDRRVRSGAQKELRFARTIGRGARPVVTSRARGAVRSACPVTRTGVSGRYEKRVRSWGLTVGVVTIGGSDAVERVRSVLTGASGHPEKRAVKGYNGSIRMGCL